jgi:IclR family transcriptional regulator, pca regulon regulatory protein
MSDNRPVHMSPVENVLDSNILPDSTARVAAESAGGGEPEDPYRRGDPDFMASLAKGLQVIRAFGGADRRLSISAISRGTGITRAAVRRCLYTLGELGYVANEGRAFFLRPKVLDLGFAYVATAPIPIAAQPVLEELSSQLHEAASVAVLDEGAVVYVARAASRRHPAVRVGSRLPAYCTALGRVLLASLPADQAGAELSKFELVARTPFTVTSRERLQEILSQVRNDSYALNDQELTVGLRSIAVPVRNAAGATVAAMSVSTQAERVSRRVLLENDLPVLKTAAVRLGRQLAPPR